MNNNDIQNYLPHRYPFLLIDKIIGTSLLFIGFIILGPIFGIIGLASVFVLTIVFDASFLFCITKIKKLN